MKLVVVILLSTLLAVESRRYGGGGSRTSSSGGQRGGSSGGRGGSSGGQRGGSSPPSGSGGWQSPSNSGSHTNDQGHGSQPPRSGTNYGWASQPSRTQDTHQQSGSPTGWKAPGQTNSNSAPPQSGWASQPSRTQDTHQQSGSPTGWKTPAQNSPTQTAGNTPTQNNPAWKPPVNSQPTQSHQPSNGQPYGWKAPTNQNPPYPSNPQAKPPPSLPTQGGQKYGWSNPSPNIQPSSHQPNYFTAYSQGYAHGVHNSAQQRMAQPSQYGFGSSYYPSQNHFGYPGQGVFGAQYGGHSMFGSPGQYAYPNSGSWGVPSYGTGNNHNFAKGLLAGAVGGVLLNSAFHSLTHNHHQTSNPWGYTGSGYGSQYTYKTINNHYYNNSTTNNSTNKSSEPDHWLHCVAFDPTTQTTLVNPNCSCTVEVTTDPATNLSVSTHHCTSPQGTVTEKTPVGRYAPGIELVDDNVITVKDMNPEKYRQNKTLTETERLREEFYLKLEKLVHMGSFTS